MLSDRLTRRTTFLGLLGLAGCGFVPVYGETSAIRGKFAFDTGNSVLGFHLGARLSDRLGAPDGPAYVIKVTARATERSAAITAQGQQARFNLIGIADWSIVATATGQQIATDRSEAFTSYAATSSTVATQATRDDARNRLAVILADMIVTRVLALASTGDLPG